MTRFLRPLLLLAVFVGCGGYGSITFLDLGTLLSSTALSTGPTFIIYNPGGMYKQANLIMARTRSAGTDMTMTCTRSLNNGTTKGTMQNCTDSSGTCTHNTVTLKSPTSSTETLAWELTVLGWPYSQCTMASASSTGSDLLVVTGALIAER